MNQKWSISRNKLVVTTRKRQARKKGTTNVNFVQCGSEDRWQFSFQVASDTKVKRKGKTKQIFPSQGPIMKAHDDDASESCCGVTVLIDETSSEVPSHDSI